MLAIALAVLLGASEARAQAATDYCGCAGSPDSLGDFVLTDPATYPPGSDPAPILDVFGGCQDALRIPLPPDGVLVFDSLVLDRFNPIRGCFTHLAFRPNAANTPVTILVKGDVTIDAYSRINVSGSTGGAGSSGAPGTPGQPGHGGFAGGEGAYQIVNFASIGGNGIGPGGGLGSTVTPSATAAGGTFFGVPELRPLLGGSGGGGGRSAGTTSGFAGGAGGGGGGALLLAANGTITVNGLILADGGAGGPGHGSGTGGGGGSGGAIRLLANRIQGSGFLFARGGAGGNCCVLAGGTGGAGRIRMEAISNTFSADNTTPVAARAPAPGPLVNPITPTVRITGIDGAASPAEPVGFRNAVDMLVDAPGVILINLATTDVPAGTDLAVTVKPKVGAAPVTQNVTIAAGSCNAGACTAATGFDLAAGAYIVEARATFQTP
jgi:hypothetical protein